MSSQSDDPVADTQEIEDPVRAVRRSVYERLSDPYLNDHDRWVLRQFGRFLNGIAPEPGPRALRIGDGRALERNQLDAG
jgi:hypothetical protein